MKRFSNLTARWMSVLVLLAASTFCIQAASRILAPDIKSLRVMVGDDFLSPPVLTLGRGEVLNISFDQMSHQYHRYIYHLELCDADWTPTEGLFESDYMDGFNDNPIEDYAESEGCNVLYTHYSLQLPNERCRPKLSGNYRLHILDDDNGGEEVAVAEFYIVRPLVLVGLGVTTNTDIGLNHTAQQVSMTVKYQDLRVTRPDEQLRTVVRQNNREDTERRDVPPTYSTVQGLAWEHNQGLLFPGGNEYHKFELLDNDHPSMGVERIEWDGENYHAYPIVCEPRRNYLYDEDADGAYMIRNSDNWYNDTQSDYLWVHYKIRSLPGIPPVQGASVVLQGQWTVEPQENYVADYDAEDHSYNVAVMQKQGYYNYQFLLRDFDGTTHPMPEEGNFYQTENRYQAFIYYRPQGGRSWLLVGYQQVVFSSR
jgi:hypothetical protein